jgi:catechol 2,3-dioxygenase-like lactoylglutathione lyase family enzyme
MKEQRSRAPIRLDHLVVLVNNLGRATRDYERLGFRVTSGGEHADGLTHNALIPFIDGTYVELVAFLDRDDPRDNLWGWRSAGASGLIDWCVASDDLQTRIRTLAEHGGQAGDPFAGGRRLPDGTELKWRTVRFKQEGRVLPFLIEDLTPRERRIAGGPALEHPNGVRGIAKVKVAVADPDQSAALFKALTGEEEVTRQPIQDLHAIEYEVRTGPHAIGLVAPAEQRGPIQAHLDARGPGPFGISLTTHEQGSGAFLDTRRTHGARIELL